jgi:hypothetical protein
MNPLHLAEKYKSYARQVRNDIMRQSTCTAKLECNTTSIRQVILMLSASRGGSSLLFHLLAQTGQLLSLDGEHVPYYKLNSFSAFESNSSSDEISSAANGDISGLSQDIIAGLGMGPELKQPDIDEFANRLALQFPLQWPRLNISAEELIWHIRRAYTTFYAHHSQWDSSLYLLWLFQLMRSTHPQVNPYYYDLLSTGREKYFIGCQAALEPPDPYYCLEEPPFIAVRPRKYPEVKDIKEKPLLLKASIDAYRLPLLSALFPNAEFKVIHLVRNPAASINGLYDGWLDRGFYSYNLASYGEELAIQGYSDRYAWGRDWWNFDLPPQWEKLINMPLEYVCGAQWLGSHEAIINNLASLRHYSVMRVCFEDIILSTAHRYQTIERILKFIGIDKDTELWSILQRPPVIMSTRPPQIDRWLARKDLLFPVLHQASIKSMSHELGYTSAQLKKEVTR